MDLSTALLKHLPLLNDTPTIEQLQSTASALNQSLISAINSHLGVQLTIERHGQPITLSVIEGGATMQDVTTSLTLPLGESDPATDQQPPQMTCFASTPGALVDLAADLTYALGIPAEHIRMDQAIDITAFTTGVSGLEEVSIIEQAIGLLIGAGNVPDDALGHLANQALNNDTQHSH